MRLFLLSSARTVDPDGAGAAGSTTEHYVYDDTDVAFDFYDADGSGKTYSPELARRYLWNPQAVDQLLAQEAYDDGSVDDVLYPVRDNLGSTRSLVEYDGAIAATYSYDSYGNVISGPLTATRYLYTCQEYDLTTGFYYYDARWYDPAVGKFISEDPIGYDAGDMNLYRYCDNEPILHTDPSGCLEWTRYEYVDPLCQQFLKATLPPTPPGGWNLSNIVAYYAACLELNNNADDCGECVDSAYSTHQNLCDKLWGMKKGACLFAAKGTYETALGECAQKP